MSFDGIDEETNILQRIGDLAGGRILNSEPDDTSIPVDSLGKVRPYIVVSIGVPFATSGGSRSMGDGEEHVPYTLTMVIGCYAKDRASLNLLYKAVAERLVGWTPVDGNSTPIKLPYAFNSGSAQTAVRPAIMSKIAAMVTTINLSTR
jgi:hypothetical protein